MKPLPLHLDMRPISELRPTTDGPEWEHYLAIDRLGNAYIVYWTGEWTWGQFNAGRSVPEGRLVMAARLPTQASNRVFLSNLMENE